MLKSGVPSLAPEILAAFLGITACAGFVQGSVGFGFAIVSVPLLSLVDPRLAPVPQLLVQVPLTLAIFWRERQAADWGGALFTTIGRVPGTLVGMALLAVATRTLLDLIIGGIVLVGVLILASGRAVPRTRMTELVAGLFSGGSAVISAIGGPPIALLYKDDDGPRVRATLSLIFAMGLVVTILGRAAAGALPSEGLILGAVALPATLLGFFLSRFATAWIEGRRMQIAILLISGASAVALLLRGFVGATVLG